MLVPRDNRKDLREVPRRVLKAMRIVLVSHVDDVLREALALEDSTVHFPQVRTLVEYRFGEVVITNPVVIAPPVDVVAQVPQVH